MSLHWRVCWRSSSSSWAWALHSTSGNWKGESTPDSSGGQFQDGLQHSPARYPDPLLRQFPRRDNVRELCHRPIRYRSNFRTTSSSKQWYTQLLPVHRAWIKLRHCKRRGLSGGSGYLEGKILQGPDKLRAKPSCFEKPMVDLARCRWCREKSHCNFSRHVNHMLPVRYSTRPSDPWGLLNCWVVLPRGRWNIDGGLGLCFQHRSLCHCSEYGPTLLFILQHLVLQPGRFSSNLAANCPGESHDLGSRGFQTIEPARGWIRACSSARDPISRICSPRNSSVSLSQQVVTYRLRLACASLRVLCL